MSDLPTHKNHSDVTSIQSLSIAFIGCGSVGCCLGKLLHKAGIHITSVCCRTQLSAQKACRFIGTGVPFDAQETEKAASSASVVIFATPDKEISKAEAAAAKGLKKGSAALHLSGALPSSILRQCRSRGVFVGSMHPLQSFADPKGAMDLVPGSIFACEGDEEAVAVSFEIARHIGGKPIRMETAFKPIYHAAAAAASNFLIVPLLLALDLMEAAGIGRSMGLEALKPLILGTARNATSKGVPSALTGPIERGELMVVEGHLETIERTCPTLKPKYIELALMTVEAAYRKGSLEEIQAEEITALLQRYGRK